ncbi:phosphatidylinositol N-acetylglucosaminyltransferase subunit Y-domain-containing protein [Paraphysoderma sedebokerense]|nr:phosphatidylinositol N-acetylglucosaminyltransferase subunit Y-domain-containing protein [Paraphysoderma sedebokerense]
MNTSPESANTHAHYRNRTQYYSSSELINDKTHVYGWLLLITSAFTFVGGLYSTVISKWMPYTGIEILDLIKRDEYYCYLVPLTLPVTIAFIHLNWLGMKLFRHSPGMNTSNSALKAKRTMKKTE